MELRHPTRRPLQLLPAATHPELPQAIEAEKATLGSILLNRDAIIAVADWLDPSQFYYERHAQIYAAMLACYRRRIPPDIRTVADELRQRNQMEAIDGISYLSDLVDCVPTSYHVAYYAQAVADAARLRAVISAGGKIAAVGYQTDLGADAAVAEAHTILTQATQTSSAADLVPIEQIVDAVWTRLSAGENDAIPTGFADLDHILGGLYGGDLLLLAARPAMGKTALALSLTRQLARRGTPVLFFSLEMSREQLVQRLAAMEAHVSLQHIRHQQLSEDDLSRLCGALGAVAAWPIVVCDLADQTPSALRARVMRYLAEHPGSVVILDYLQLMTDGSESENRVQEVSAISRALKTLARDAGVPVLALSQLSRAVESRASKVPQLSDLRESGSLEQDADIVLMLYRDEVYDRETDKKGIAELYIAKHRNGPLGVVPLRFDAQMTRFDSISYRGAP